MSGQFDFSGPGSRPTPPSLGTPGAPAAASTPFSLAADGASAPPTPATASTAAPRPPVVWLIAGIALAVVAAAAALLFPAQPAITIAAWFAAGPVAISLFAVFSFADTGRRASVLYSVDPVVVWLYRIGLAVVFAAIVTSALVIAQWAGRL